MFVAFFLQALLYSSFEHACNVYSTTPNFNSHFLRSHETLLPFDRHFMLFGRNKNCWIHVSNICPIIDRFFLQLSIKNKSRTINLLKFKCLIGQWSVLERI